MEISGTVAGNATVNTVGANKSVVNFTLALNETYKTQSGEYRERTQFIRYACWNRPAVAKILTKGTGVNITGWLNDPHVWIDEITGICKARLEFTAQTIKLVGRVVRDTPEPAETGAPVNEKEPADDLPF